MKSHLALIALLVFFAVACKKTSTSNSRVLFYNATWSLPAITAAWNGDAVIAAPLAQGQTTGTFSSPYLPVPAGTNLVTLQSGTDTLANKNVYTNDAGGSSFIFFDSSATIPSAMVLQLKDDLSQPDTAEIKIRVINASPDTSARFDMWVVNGNTDSTAWATGVAFIGASATAAIVEKFLTPVKYHGEGYTIRIKKAGTETLLTSVTGSFFAVKGIYTFVFSGISGGSASTGFKLSVLHNFVQ